MRRGAATEGESVGAVIGREAELKALERLLDSMPAAPAGVVVEGEASIGKTILWLEGVRAAAARGYRVLEARPAESEVQLPYAALADLVGGVFDETRALLPPPQERALTLRRGRAAAARRSARAASSRQTPSPGGERRSANASARPDADGDEHRLLAGERGQRADERRRADQAHATAGRIQRGGPRG